jgi:hypothetical protein
MDIGGRWLLGVYHDDDHISRGPSRRYGSPSPARSLNVSAPNGSQDSGTAKYLNAHDQKVAP